MSSSKDNDETRNFRSAVALKIIVMASVTVEGLFYYIPGPTLLDLIDKVYEPVINVTLIYCARAVGRIIGTLVGSFTFQWLLQSRHRSLLMFLTVLLMAVTCILIAITVAFDVILILFGLSGLAMGIMDTGTNAMCLHSRIHTSTFFCILSCLYGFGAFMSPVLARNFLKKHVNVTSENLDAPIKNYTEIHRNELHKKLIIGYWTSVSHVYVIVGALLFIVALLWLAYYAFSMTYFTITEPVWLKQSNVILWNLTICNASLMTFVSEVIAFGYPQILPSYLTINFHKNQAENLDYVIMFLGFFLFGRIVTTLQTTNYFCRVPLKIMLAVSIVLLYGGVIVLYLDNNNEHTLFLAAQAVIGAGVSPIFISTYLWLCCKVYVTHRSMNQIFVMHTVSELIFPWLLGKYGWTNPGNIKHFMIIVVVIISVLFLIQYYFLVDVKKDPCPECEQEIASRASPQPVLLKINAAIHTFQPQRRRSRTLSGVETRVLTSFKIESTHNILEDISELEKRVQRGNTLAKSAFEHLEYTVKRL